MSSRTVKSYGEEWKINKHTVLGTPNRKYHSLDINKDHLQDLLSYGFTTKYISELYNVDPHTIIKYKNKFGIKDKRINIQRENIEKLLDKGMTTTKIAGELGIGRTTLVRLKSKYGLSRKRG